MKKFLTVVLLMSITAVCVFAWEVEDITKYPPCMDKSNWILNLGIGFGLNAFEYLLDKDYVYIPPVRLSFDKNIPIGASNLPFFFGGIVRYSMYGHRDAAWYWHNVPVGVRIGYHFNWDVDKLDTYAVTTVGWVVGFATGNKDNDSVDLPKPPEPKIWDNVMINVGLGARWFVNDWFGFWLEAGLAPNPKDLFGFDIGFSFKF